MNLANFAISMIENNPQIKNNPEAQEMINVIRNNDQKKGQEIANNICKSYGITQEEAINQARQFFKI